MERIRAEAEACHITFGESPYQDFAFDEEKFIELVRQSYQHINHPKESIFWTKHEDGINFTCSILAEQAVLDNNMAFFEKIITQCDLTDCYPYFFLAVVKTKRWEFIKKLLEANTRHGPEDYLYGLKGTLALTAITCFETLFTPKEQFLRFADKFPLHWYSFGLCLAFLEKGVPLQTILEYADRELKDILVKEDI